MNPNKLNECIDIMADQYEAINPGHEAVKIMRKWKSCASFHMDMPQISPKIDEHEKGALMVEDRICLPFSNVRLFDTLPGTKGERHHYLFHASNQRVIIGDIMEAKEGHIAGIMSEIRTCHLVGLIACGKPAQFAGIMMLIKPEWVIFDDAREGDPPHQENINKLCEFINIVNCPRHHVCKVTRGSTAGRSVEWVERKSHYIVLGPEHAKQVREGFTYGGFDGKITRSMHNRRAHMRTLTHARYTRKKGLKIWVNAAWVGPKEWKDKIGNSYKIVEGVKVKI